MAAQRVNFRVGSQFFSYNEFKVALKEYENQENANYYVAGSTLLTRRRNVPAQICETMYYSEARLKCKFAGNARKIIDENERQRKGNSYRQNCEAFFKVIFRETARGPVLEIVTMSEDHSTHVRAETLYKAMPRQRSKTIDGVSEYLKKASGAKANIPLLQAQISSRDNYATRQDIRNRINKSSDNSSQLNLTELEKMVNEMKCVSGATVKVFYNTNNELEGVLFQDKRMKAYFEHFPELLMFDGTYSLNDLRMPLVILLVIDGNAESQIAGFFVVKSENSAMFNVLFDHFKRENPKHDSIEVILTDKHAANRNVVQNQFPNAAHNLCIFHVGQNFEREVTTKKRGITKDQRKRCLGILNKMIYAQNQGEFDDLYQQLRDTRCQGK